MRFLRRIIASNRMLNVLRGVELWARSLAGSLAELSKVQANEVCLYWMLCGINLTPKIDLALLAFD